MFLEGVWDASRHVCAPFDIPQEWKRFRSLDWGYAAPYSVLWYAIDYDGKAYVYRELYGAGKEPGKGCREDAVQVARRIKDIEQDERQRGIRFDHNPADTSIWMQDGRHKSINDLFLEEDVIWSQASKGPGSRINGAQEIIQRLRSGSVQVFDTCRNFLKHIPMIPADKKCPEDVDTESQDHDWDSFRYGMMSRQPKSREPGGSKRPEAGSYAWVTDADGLLLVPFDSSSFSTPQRVINSGSSSADVSIAGGVGVVAALERGVEVLDLVAP